MKSNLMLFVATLATLCAAQTLHGSAASSAASADAKAGAEFSTGASTTASNFTWKKFKGTTTGKLSIEDEYPVGNGTDKPVHLDATTVALPKGLVYLRNNSSQPIPTPQGERRPVFEVTNTTNGQVVDLFKPYVYSRWASQSLKGCRHGYVFWRKITKIHESGVRYLGNWAEAYEEPVDQASLTTDSAPISAAAAAAAAPASSSNSTPASASATSASAPASGLTVMLDGKPVQPTAKK